MASGADGPLPGNVPQIYLARALRDFGDGFVALLLPVYLAARGFGVLEVGLVATLGLLGSALTTLGIGVYGARFDGRRLLIACALLMAASGLAFAASGTLVLISIVALLGTINPSAGSVSIFVPLEHAALARSVEAVGRTRVFARYSLVGALAAALGAPAAAAPEFFSSSGIATIGALQAMFLAYAVLGLASGFVYARLTPEALAARALSGAALGPSRRVVYKLAALFAVDAFAGGFVVQSLLALWLFDKFGLSLAAVGALFLWTGVASAFSFPVAAWLAGRIGLINTMVFTHIPSSLCLIFAALVPRADLALAALVVRAFLSQMDVPTRSSYVMAVVTPAERTAAAGFTAVPRSLAAAISPVLAGALFAAGYRAWPLILCGSLKIAYDLALLWTFRDVKPPEERLPRVPGAARLDGRS